MTYCMKKKKSLIKNKWKDEEQRLLTLQNPSHILLVNLLWHKIVAVQILPLIWPLALRLWSVSEAV